MRQEKRKKGRNVLLENQDKETGHKNLFYFHSYGKH